MLFRAATEYHEVEEENNTYVIPVTDEVLTTRGWIKVKELSVGDTICGEDTQETVQHIEITTDKNYIIKV